MSADAWRVCPKCKDDIERQISSAYGKIPQAEYIALLDRHDKIETQETLREDYEMWTDDLGLFFVKYSCSCTTCGFKHEFKHEEQVYQGKSND